MMQSLYLNIDLDPRNPQGTLKYEKSSLFRVTGFPAKTTSPLLQSAFQETGMLTVLEIIWIDDSLLFLALCLTADCEKAGMDMVITQH